MSEQEKQMPDGCICDPGEWAEVIPICDRYSGDGKQYCRTCEHDYACHVAAPLKTGAI